LARTQFRHSWLSYGRLRPLHTNAVIFAFGGCGLFATSYYVVQRTCQVRLFADKLAAFTFWAGSWSLWLLRSPCRWATPKARNTPNSSGRSTS
jgi:cytochrome c oxidase cbb3-type subunit 1